MTISTRYVFRGDEKRAISIAGIGRHQMKILKNLMAFQDLKQLSRSASYEDGTVIKCSSLFGQDRIDIFSPPAPVVIDVTLPEEEEFPTFWRFKLFRDDDTTKRDGAGNITKASGTLIDLALLDMISIVAGGERVSKHINNYVVKNDDGTYTLKNKKQEDFVFGQYWTFSGSVWNYDDSAGYPYKPGIGSFNPATGSYTVNPGLWLENVGGLPGNSTWGADYWILNEENGIWYYDDSEDWPDDPWTGSYNPATGYYTVDQKQKIGTAKVIFPAVTVPNDTDFWVVYNCREHFVPDSYYHTSDGYWHLDVTPQKINYPYKYKKADNYEQSNKISMGTYKGNVPYWELTDQGFSPEPVEKPWNWRPSNNCDVTTFTWAPGTYGGTIWFKSPFATQKILKTSIPYKKQYVFEGTGGASWRGWGDYIPETDKCGSSPRCTSIKDCGKQDAHKKSTMYSTDIVNLSSNNLYIDLPYIKIFESDLFDHPASIETEVEVRVNIQTQQSNFCYVCYDTGLEEHIYKPASLENVKIIHFSRDIQVYMLYE